MILRGISKNLKFMIVDSTKIVNEVIQKTNIEPLFYKDVAKIITTAIILSQNSKDNKIAVNLKSKNSALNSMVVKTTKNRNLAVNINIDQEKYEKLLLAINENNSEEIEKLYSLKGSELIIQMGYDRTYSSLMLVKDSLLELTLNEYFEKSEQTKTIFICSMKYDENLNCKASTGLFIQLLPNSDEEILNKMANKIERLTSLTEMVDNGFTLEKIVYLIFEDDIEIFNNQSKYANLNYKFMPLIEDIKILEIRDIKYECDCNKEYMKEVLKTTLDKKESEEIIKNEKFIEIVCNFCNKKYKFNNLEEIYEK